MNNRDNDSDAFHPSADKAIYGNPIKNIEVTWGQPMNGGRGGSGNRSGSIPGIKFNPAALAKPTAVEHLPFSMGQFAGPIMRTQAVRAKLIDQEQQAILARTHQQIQEDINTVLNNSGPVQQPTALNVVIREKSAVDSLIAFKNNEIAAHTAIANSFYGDSPFNKPFHEFTKRATSLQNARTHEEGLRVFNQWLQSYHSAHVAKNLSEAVRQLSVRSSSLAATEAVLTAQLIAQQQAENAARAAQQQADEAARRLAQQQAEAAARHLAQQQAEAEARAKAEQARIDTEARAKVSAKSATALSPAQGLAAPLETAFKAGQELFTGLTGLLGKANGVALMLHSSTLADGERSALSVRAPLAHLDLPAGVDLNYIAGVKGNVDVSHRLVADATGDSSAPGWAVTDGVRVSTKVRVRSPIYNAGNNTYEFTRDGETTPVFVWTPIVSPGNSSTISPAGPPALPADPGVSVGPVVSDLVTNPGIVGNDPDDYILIFPSDSGLPDSYVLFKDPRDIAGRASGYGKPVTGTWLGEITRGEGAPIPSQIADQLRGRDFSSFKDLRETLWEAVANDPELSKQFIAGNLEIMSRGNAPFSRAEDQVDGRDKFEIHHKHEVAQGGAVYDIDNFSIMTPKRHIAHHSGKRQ